MNATEAQGLRARAIALYEAEQEREAQIENSRIALRRVRLLKAFAAIDIVGTSPRWQTDGAGWPIAIIDDIPFRMLGESLEAELVFPGQSPAWKGIHNLEELGLYLTRAKATP